MFMFTLLVWQVCFGRILVATASGLGCQGSSLARGVLEPEYSNRSEPSTSLPS